MYYFTLDEIPNRETGLTSRSANLAVFRVDMVILLGCLLTGAHEPKNCVPWNRSIRESSVDAVSTRVQVVSVNPTFFGIDILLYLRPKEESFKDDIYFILTKHLMRESAARRVVMGVLGAE